MDRPRKLDWAEMAVLKRVAREPMTGGFCPVSPNVLAVIKAMPGGLFLTETRDDGKTYVGLTDAAHAVLTYT